MRLLLISANREAINMPTWPLGLACVAAQAKEAGHEVRLLDLMHVQEPRPVIEEAIGECQPRVIGISVRNIDDQRMHETEFLLPEVRRVVVDCKSLTPAPIVLGGAGYSMFPESSLSYLGADMGIQGEGENAFSALLERLETHADLSDVPGLYSPGVGLQANRKLEMDLDRLPLPEVDLLSSPLAEAPEFWFPVQTRRGCPMNCAYCSTATIEGTLFRKRSPERVVQWIARWVEAGVRRLFFVDNTFNLPLSYAKNVCDRLAAADMGLVWRSIVYPHRLDQALAESMAKAGCTEVSLGFESGSENILSVLNKRFKPDDVRHASRLLGDHGIARMGFLLLGGPGETRESVEQSLAFADSLHLEAMKVTVGIRIYPHTDLARIAVEQGVLDRNDDLLRPRFYLERGLEDWLPEIVEQWMSERPNWMT